MDTQDTGIFSEPPTLLIKPVVRKEEPQEETKEEVKQEPAEDGERLKYERMWGIKEYRSFAPGEHVYQTFLDLAKPNPGDTVIDFGCGTGRGALMLALIGRLNVTMVDFAENCLDDDVRSMLTTQSHALRFVQGDLRKPIRASARYGFNTDVLEHLPPEDVDAAISNILNAAQSVFFQISTEDDAFGKEIGEPLHLTVRPASWWKEKFKEHDAVIHWMEERNGVVGFYVSAWNDASVLMQFGSINTEQDVIRKQIFDNVDRQIPQVSPHQSQDVEVILLGGGPSLEQFADEIKAKRDAGAKLVTTNGTYNWALSKGMVPSAQIMVDARLFNIRFVQPVVPNCKYLIASQCHPAVFNALPPEQTWLWHSVISEELAEPLQEYYNAKGIPWYPIPGGSTVMLRAIPLLRMLGFHKFSIYGFDSCLSEDGAHHAYLQPENDYEKILKVSCGGRIFMCHAWMCSQAQEFLDLMRLLVDEVELAVHGDGLIRHILETGAAMVEVKEDDNV